MPACPQGRNRPLRRTGIFTEVTIMQCSQYSEGIDFLLKTPGTPFFIRGGNNRLDVERFTKLLEVICHVACSQAALCFFSGEDRRTLIGIQVGCTDAKIVLSIARY